MLVFAVSREKELESMVAELRGLGAAWLLPPIQSPRARASGELAEQLRTLLPGVEIDTPKTLAVALEQARVSGRRVLVAGSLFLIGEVLGLLEGGAFEVSGQ